MNELTRQIGTIAHGVWRHRWMGISVAWVVALLGAGVVWVVQDRFEARAQVYVDTQTVLKPLMVGLAFQPDVDQQVRMLGKTLISRPNIDRLVNDKAIGLLKTGSSVEQDQVAESLMKTIKVQLTGGNNLYAITYRDIDGQRAQRVVEGLVNLFMDSGVDTKRRDSQEASRFIDEQIKSYETKLSDAENRVKEFKLRNLNAGAANTNQDYFGRMSALTDEINRLRMQLSAAEQSRDALKRELALEVPNLPVDAASAISMTPEQDARIEVQKRQLDELLRRFTEEHPDVIAARRTIREIEAQRREALLAKVNAIKAASKAGQTAATNPVFQNIRNRQVEAEAAVASLRAQLSTQQVRLEETRAQAGKVPQAEAELAQLNRDYDVIRKNYEQLVTRREAASLGVKIDQSSSMAEFRLVEPPRVLPQPVFPGKRQLAMGLMVIALLIGAAAAYIKTLINPSFASERELREFTKRPVLGALSVVADPRAAALDRQDRLRLAGVFGLYVLAHVGWLGVIVLRSGA
jgi:polysaccharide chain length determinant protein (PEP-CTERM system associated)